MMSHTLPHRLQSDSPHKTLPVVRLGSHALNSEILSPPFPTQESRVKRAALYARVSTQRQEDEQTIENQILEIQERAAKDGNVLLEQCFYLDDGWTGELLARPALDQMRQDARKGLFDVLYVYDRGRLSRKFVYQEIIIEELTDLEIEFIPLHDKEATTPEEKIFQGFQGLFAEYERIKILERFRSGRLRKLRSGRLIGHNAPYGYDYIPKTKDRDGYFVINESEAAVVRQIFRWVGEERVSLREVRRRLLALGIPPRKQKRPVWTEGPIQRLLRNPSYIGVHYYYTSEAVVSKNPKNTSPYRRVKKTSRKRRPQEEWVEIPLPPLIAPELFDKVQQQLRLNAKFSPRNVRHDYLLRGLIYCPCGLKRTGEGVNGHLYYRCTDRLHQFPLAPQCQGGGVNVKVVDVLVWHKLVELLTNRPLVEEQAKRWLGQQQASERHSDELMEDMQQTKQRLLQEEERYTRAYGEGVMSFEVYTRQMERLQQQRQPLEEQVLATSRNPRAAAQPSITAEMLTQLAIDTLATLDFGNRQQVVRQLVERVAADREEVVIVGHIPVKQGGYMELRHEDRHTQDAILLPFELTANMPAYDSPGGYSKEFCDNLVFRTPSFSRQG